MRRALRPAPFRTGTALERYVRLEATGLWRDGPQAEPREVVVAFGTATLVIRDPSDVALGHWALAGVRALGRDGTATRYAMTPDGYETLAIADPEMVAAIDAVTAAARGFPPPAPARPRRRWPAVLAALVAAGGLAAAVPPLLRAGAARMVPPEVAHRLGDEMLLRLIESRGPACADPAGAAALARLAEMLAETPAETPAGMVAGLAPRLRLLDLDRPAAALPGNLVLLDRDLPADAEGPAEIAGWIVLARAAAERAPPVGSLMASAGPLANARYILTGQLPDAALARGAAAALAEPLLPPSAAPALAARLAEVGVPADPLAAGLRRTGAGAAADALLAAARPSAPAPRLADAEAAALRGACR